MDSTEVRTNTVAPLTCFVISVSLHLFGARFFRGKRSCLAPAVAWFFTFSCIRKNMMPFFSLLPMIHAFLATLLYFKIGKSNALLNRTFIFPAAGSTLAFLLSPCMPTMCSSTVAGMVLLQVWSLFGGLLMLIVFPASMLSTMGSRVELEERLKRFMRHSTDCTFDRFPIHTRDGVDLDTLVICRKVPTNRWVVYFGGNAEIMENSVEELCATNAHLHLNWVFFNPRGVGRSTGHVSNVQDLVTDAAFVIETVSQKYAIAHRQLLLWGHSIGGGVAAAVALHCGGYPSILLDRTFSRLSDAAVRFSPLNAVVTRLLIRGTVGDLDVVACCKKRVNKKLVIYHRKDEVIDFAMASLGRQEILADINMDSSVVIELCDIHVQSPHNSGFSSFSERSIIYSRVCDLFTQ